MLNIFIHHVSECLISSASVTQTGKLLYLQKHALFLHKLLSVQAAAICCFSYVRTYIIAFRTTPLETFSTMWRLDDKQIFVTSFKPK